MWNEDTGFDAQIVINGAAQELEVGANFVATIQEKAREASLVNFRVFVNNEEIEDPSEAPATVESGMTITVKPYDEAGKLE